MAEQIATSTKPIPTFKDIINETEKFVDTLYDKTYKVNELLSEIELIYDDMRGLGASGLSFSDFTPDDLSRMAGKLSVLRSSLIPLRARAWRNLSKANKFIDLRRAGLQHKLKETLETLHGKTTRDEVNAELDRQLVRATFTADLHKEMYEKLQSYWYGIPDQLKMIQLRINVIRGDSDTIHFQQHLSDNDDVPYQSSNEFDFEIDDSIK